MLSRHGADDSAPTLDQDRLVDPELEPRTVRGMVASTPGKLALIGVALIALTLAAGALTSVAIIAREQRIDTLHLETAPRTHSAQELYSSLSIADAAATAGFLSGRVEPAAVRDSYNQAIGEASTAIVSTTDDVSASDAQTAAPAKLSRELSFYTAIVATARANSRVGNPIGVSYLNESSALMHDIMLPAAEQLYTKQAEAQADTQRHLSQPPRAALALCVVALIALIVAQRYLARRSHRRVNLGMIAATVLMALLAIWLSIAGLVSTNASTHDTESAATMDALVRARIQAQQARADETLALLRRDSDVQNEQEYAQHVAEVARILDGLHGEPAPTDAAVNDAVAALDGWEQAHKDLRDHLSAGDYVGAVTIAVDGRPQDSAAQFTRLDDALRGGIGSLREEASGYTSRSWSSLSRLDVGGVTLGVLAGFAIGAGIWPRLSEYR